MKKILILVLSTVFSAPLFGQAWTLSRGNVGFTIVHLKVSEVEGSFGVFDAKLSSTKSDFTDLKIDFTADVASVNTNSKGRDKEIKKEEYFNVDVHPKITFKGTSVKKAGGQKYKIAGNLTIKGVTKPIILDATISTKDPKKTLSIEASTKINRIDFGVGTSGMSLNDDVNLKISGEFSK